MRVLIMGSGGIGGYFGGMLALRGGQDVTFVARGAHAFLFARLFLALEQERPAP